MDYSRLKDIDIKNSVGSRVGVIFMASEVEVKSQRNSEKEFLRMVMVDKSCKREATIFDVSDIMKNKVTNGAVLAAEIDIKPYKAGKDGISCIVANIYTTEYSPLEFADWVSNLEVYNGIIERFMGLFTNPKYAAIVHAMLSKYWEKFVVFPAGKGMHHTEFGGLMMHTATVTDLSYRIGIKYNEVYGGKFVNLELLIAAGLLHDVMKVKEFAVDMATFGVEYSAAAVLTGHVIDIAMEVKAVAQQLGYGEDDEEVKTLVHCLLAHHGKMEWGSPVEPHIIEAFILHHADVIDSEAWCYNKNLLELNTGEYYKSWSAGGLRVFYKHGKDDEKATE